jgi:hypothetical protein
MNPQNQPDREQELKQREEALRQRELEIRLRELDAEINTQTNNTDQTPTHATVKHRPSWFSQLNYAGKFFGIVVAVIVAVKVASWVAAMLLFGTIVWVTFQLFRISQRRS